MSNLTLRYSDLENCLSEITGCPRRFYHQKFKKAPRTSTPELDEGNAAHAVLQKWHAEEHEIDVYTTVLEACLEYPTLDLKNAKNVLPMVLGYLKRFTPDGHEATIYLERKLPVKIGDVDFSGTPDYVAVYPDGTARLSDYKTGRLKLKTMQMRTYGWLNHLHHGIKELVAEKYYLRDATMGGQEFMQKDDFDEAGKWVWNSINTIRAMLDKGENSFPAKTNYYCQFCEVSTDCPLAEKNTSKLKTLPIPEDMDIRVEEYLIFKSRLKQIETALREHVKLNGNIVLSGTEIGYFEAAEGETVEDVVKLVEILKKEEEKLKALKLSLPKLIKVDSTKFDQFMRKIRKNDHELVLKVEKLLVPKPVRQSFTAKLVEEAKEVS